MSLDAAHTVTVQNDILSDPCMCTSGVPCAARSKHDLGEDPLLRGLWSSMVVSANKFAPGVLQQVVDRRRCTCGAGQAYRISR